MQLLLTNVAFLLSFAMILTGCASPQAGPSAAAGPAATVAVIRHAEASSAFGADPELTVGGRERAFALADALQQAGVTAIYASQYRRTQLTAQPLADILGLDVIVIPVEGGDIEAQAEEIAGRIRTEHAGEVVLVIGHSNTVPLIVQALSGLTVRPLREDQFGDLFIVTTAAEGERGRLIHAHVGQ